ncbi:MAG TPA: hypothetical protein P5567_09770 [Kiritimatiellia bacterium]|nr:hypothetical protein [Kiritimatiellia bacterium]HRZ12728.1 hypothetical protein [Kiritimatiellia bacterium]HSA18320.1 hypothetical protein [Kiritimatiellia bacterium]
MISLRHAIVLTIALAAGLAPALEPLPEYNTGAVPKLKGYGNAPQEIYAAPPVVLDINTRAHESLDDSWSELTADANSQRDLFALLLATSLGAGLWENHPSSRLEFQLGQLVSLSAVNLKDQHNVLTLDSHFDHSGIAKPILVKEGPGVMAISEFDIRLARSLLTTNAGMAIVDTPWGLIQMPMTNDWRIGAVSMAHELGHGIGLNHSYLGQYDDVLSASSVMAINRQYGQMQILAQGLCEDDVAALCRLYPRHAQRLSGATGSVIGRLVDSSGGQDLFGGIATLVAPGERTLYHRISGFDTSLAAAKRGGFFCLDGVKPGTYELRVFPYTHFMAQPIIHALALEEDGSTVSLGLPPEFFFAHDFKWAAVTQVIVKAGECLDLGFVKADEIRGADKPSLTLAGAQYDGAAKYSAYWFDFWRDGDTQFTHRSGSQPLPTYSARLPCGWYAVQMFGWNGSAWVTLQPWTWRNFNAKPVTLAWPKKTEPGPGGASMEAREYTAYVNAVTAAGYGLLARVFPVDATSLKTCLPPGKYTLQVQAAFAKGTPLQTALPSTTFVVP